MLNLMLLTRIQNEVMNPSFLGIADVFMDVRWIESADYNCNE